MRSAWHRGRYHTQLYCKPLQPNVSTRIARKLTAQWTDWPQSKRKAQLKAAHAYNAKLATTGQPVLGEQIDPFTTHSGSSTTDDATYKRSSKNTSYQSQLDVDDGIMDKIQIPKISVNLPIFHGSSSSDLARGIGHLYGTSLPVGGPSTHAALTGYRELVNALMFTRLNEIKIGDTFCINVMGEDARIPSRPNQRDSSRRHIETASFPMRIALLS